MSQDMDISQEEIDRETKKLDRDAESGGYHLNPDLEFTKALVRGLLVNEKRYGYQACPCRKASGVKEEDLDMICPCDYRDPDLEEFDACYCALYVSSKVLKGEVKAKSIPERRPSEKERKEKAAMKTDSGTITGNLKYPIWRCTVCGYICARENPPEVCPICKVKKERFERFL